MTSLASSFKRNNNYILCHRGAISLVGSEVNQKGLSRYVDFILQLNNRAEGKALWLDVDDLNNNRRKRDGEHYHITLISKKEVAAAEEILNMDGIKKSLQNFVSEYLSEYTSLGKDWFSFGIGQVCNRTSQAFFDVCLYPRAIALRRRLGLSTDYGFHITIGFINADIHNKNKSFQHLINASLLNDTSKYHTIAEVLDAAKCLLHYEKNNNDYNDGLNVDGIQCLLKAADILYKNQIHIDSSVAMENYIKISLIKIRLQNKIGDYHTLICIADEVSSILELKNINVSEQPNMYKFITIVSSFKGAAHVCLEYFKDALPILESSYKMESILLNYLEEKLHDERNVVAQKQCKKRLQKIRLLIKQCKQNMEEYIHSPKIFKFPRTRHVGDASDDVSSWGKAKSKNKEHYRQSAVTRDDLLLGKEEIAELCDGKTVVCLQEKIDGANLGISISYDGSIYCQNRSKYISSEDSPQYGPLDQWISVHRTILHILLEPERHILFGEWVVAKHSIPYFKLPGYFIAFDIYDAVMEKFVSVKEFHRRLRMVSTKLSLPHAPIPVVPAIVTRTFNQPDELLPYLETKSRFRNDNNNVEGVYLRVDKGKWLNKRCKLVRADFIHGIEEGHWMKRKMLKNKIDFNFSMQYLANCLEEVENSEKNNNYEHGNNNDEKNSINEKNNNDSLSEQLFNTRRRVTLKVVGTGTITMMRNFSYIIRNELAGSSTPTCYKHIEGLEFLGITLVITLTEEEPLLKKWFKNNKRSIRNAFFPVPNYNPPTLQQMIKIDSVVRKEILRGGQVLIHCGGGKGRAGSVISALLLKYGLNGIKNQILCGRKNGAFFTSEQVMKLVRDMRPGSIETTRQEQFIRNYTKYIWKEFYDCTVNDANIHNNNDEGEGDDVGNNYNNFAPQKLKRQLSEKNSNSEESFQSASELLDTLVMNPAAIKRIEKRKKKQASNEKKAKKHAQSNVPKFLMLCGFPGSGKSTFAKEMVLNGDGKFVRCNQDDLGKKACMALLSKHANGNNNNNGKHVIVDRCNVAIDERKNLMSIMFNPMPKDIACVYFDVSAEECCERIARRQDHPTIKPGTPKSKMKIVGSFRKRLTIPTKAEGFGHVYHVKTFEDADALLNKFGCK